MDEASARLPCVPLWCVMLTFGAGTTWMILSAQPGASRPDLLLFASGVGCILAACVWFFILALQRSLVWSVILLVPILNTLALPIFVRHYWGEGTRIPAFMALGGIAGEITGSLLLMTGNSPTLV